MSLEAYTGMYLSDKTQGFKWHILSIYNDKEIFALVKENDISQINNYFEKLYQDILNFKPSSSDEYEEMAESQEKCENVANLFQDLIKLNKILNKNNIKSNYISLFSAMVQHVKNDRQKIIDKVTVPAYKKISRVTKTDKKLIISEFLNSLFGDCISQMVISDLFDKFELSYSAEEVEGLIAVCLEEKELEQFEENLGSPQVKNLGDFLSLDGHQFEDYLKELFAILGYQVIRTKLSGDQGADLIIDKDNIKTVVQAKKYSGAVSNSAIQEIVAAKAHYSASMAMVVTTGRFTKSAFELAKSNNVDLWDIDKLNNVVSEINNFSEGEGMPKRTPVIIGKDSIPFVCPGCDSAIEFLLGAFPSIGEKRDLVCPECSSEFTVGLPDFAYACQGCGVSFDTLENKSTHQRSCGIFNEKLCVCQKCKQEIILDDLELEEKRNSETFKAFCSSCSELR